MIPRADWSNAAPGGTLSFKMRLRWVWGPRLFVLGLLLGAQSGCASGGRAWVHEAPRLEAGQGGALLPRELEPRPATDPSASQVDSADPTPAARRAVITLGQRAEVAEEPAAVRSSPSSTTIVQVNVTTPYGSAPVWGYGYPAYGVGGPGLGWVGERPEHPDHGPDRCETSGTPSAPGVAGDWAPPPDHGPPTISQTLPGNPWR